MTSVMDFAVSHLRYGKLYGWIVKIILKLPIVDGGEWVIFDDNDEPLRVSKIIEDFKVLLKEYKNAGKGKTETIGIFQTELESYKLTCNQIIKMVFEYWDKI